MPVVRRSRPKEDGGAQRSFGCEPTGWQPTNPTVPKTLCRETKRLMSPSWAEDSLGCRLRTICAELTLGSRPPCSKVK